MLMQIAYTTVKTAGIRLQKYHVDPSTGVSALYRLTGPEENTGCSFGLAVIY